VEAAKQAYFQRVRLTGAARRGEYSMEMASVAD